MHHGPNRTRWLAAIIVALGLLAVFAAPTFAQDAGTPVAQDSPEQQGGVGQGTLFLIYYLCDGQTAGLSFDVADPGLGNPNPPVDDCAAATDANAATFLIYPGGDLNGTPQEVTTDVNGTINVDLDETNGTPHKIVQKLPDGSQETPVEADFEIVAGQITGINAILFRTGTLDVHAYTCVGDPADNTFQVLDPSDPETPFDDAAYADCSPFVGDFFIAPYGDEDNLLPDPVTTTDGEGTVDLPTTTNASGSHLIKLLLDDSTDPKTYTDPALFDIQADKVTHVVWVQFAAATGTLQVNKIVCDGTGDPAFYVNQDAPEASDESLNCQPQSASFSVYAFGNTDNAPITFDTDEDGFYQLDGLPVTDGLDPHVLVEDAFGTQTSFDIAADETTVVNVVNFEPVAATSGSVEIEALECAGITSNDIYNGDPGDLGFDVPDGCSSTTVQVWIYPGGDDSADPTIATVEGFKSIDFDVDGSESFLIKLVDTDDTVLATGSFTIEAGQITPVQIRTPAYGSIAVYSYFCSGSGSPGFEVFAPGETPDLPSDCQTLDRDFIIKVFGGANDTFTVSTSGGTASVSGVPTTDTLEHIITNSNGAYTGSFEVAPNTTTSLVYYVWQPADSGDDSSGGGGGGGNNNDSSDSENVNQAPDTGIGPAGGLNDAMALFGLWSIVAIAGFAAYSRRRTA